jgi:anaerobic selenocysteine-containing dehydrogenase
MSCSENQGSWKDWVPFGLFGQVKPRHFREMFGVLWDNRDNLPYAWKILNHGVCDGCSLGPRGLKDDVIPGVHLCMTRLKLLRVNTMPAMDPRIVRNVGELQKLRNDELQNLGRLEFPMIRKGNSNQFERLTWDQAYTFASEAFRKVSPERMGFFCSSRGMTNEVYYVFQKLSRALGSANSIRKRTEGNCRRRRPHLPTFRFYWDRLIDSLRNRPC